MHDNGFLTYVYNSLIVTFASTALALAIGVPAAYAFSRLEFRGRDTWASTILSFRFMPPVAVAIPIFLMIQHVGLTNSYLGLILPYIAFSLPLGVWIMIGFFDEIPREIDDAALVDGCTRFGLLFRVMLPLVRPGLLVAAVFGQIFIWNEFLVGLYIINSQDRGTIPIGASALLTTESPIDWNLAAAVGVLTVIPMLVFSLLVRWIVRGITAGTVR
jgi:multiple sugar transport system permease protein